MGDLGQFEDGEINHVRALVPSKFHRVVDHDLVDITFQYSAVRQLKMKLQPPRDYPKSPLHFDLDSKTLSDRVLSKLAKGIEKETLKLKGRPHLLPVVTAIFTTLRDNILVSASDEIEDLKSILEEQDTLKTLNKKGILRLHLKDAQYFLKVSVTVPPDYPVTPVGIKFENTNFPAYLVKLFEEQLTSMKHLLVNGMTLEKILMKEKLLDDKKEVMKNKEVNTDDLADMKKDLIFLKQLGDLQESSGVKALRRKKKRMVKKETEVEKQREVEEEEQLHNFAQLDFDKNQPTLFPLLHFIVVEFVHKMANMKCALSNQFVLAPNPADAALSGFERLYCGCWFSKKALQAKFREPPFGDMFCPNCGQTVASKRYTKDYFKAQQQRWLERQRKKQEFNDISDFLGL